MRTYWLVGKTAPSQKSAMFNDIAPDLISNVDIEFSNSLNGFSDPSKPEERERNISYKTSFQSDQGLCNLLNIPSPHQLRYNTSSCCNCETKCLYNRQSDDNVIFGSQIRDSSKPKLKTCNDTYNQLCVCRLKSSSGQNRSRGPRSAPSITFRL